MSVIFFLLGLSLIAATFFLSAFIWAVKTGQFEDDYTPAIRMLFDDKPKSESMMNEPTLKENDIGN